jgi:hypothetical protein
MTTTERAQDTIEVSASSDGAGRPGRERLRRVALALIGALYLVSVPWYRDTDAPLRLIAGLPDWVAVALGCYIAVAVLNAVAWLCTDLDDPREADVVEPPHLGPVKIDGVRE